MNDEKVSVQWTTSLSFFVSMRGVCIRDSEGKIIYMHMDDVYPCFANGWIVHSALSAEDIKDKSKANRMGKAIACFQIVWLLSQIIGRSVSHLPVTLLELSTLAYVLCALVCYGFWWHAPFDVQVPVIVNATPKFDSAARDAISRSSFPEYLPESWAQYLIFSVCCAIYSLPHFLAWNAQFPTKVELYLWRVSCVSCSVLPFILMVVYNLWEKLRRFPLALTLFVMVIYAIARLYLLVESFVILRAVPPDVYTAVPWSEYIPHF
jgi:hypothetical protein